MGGTNNYQYAPNPIGWVDPFGLTAAKESSNRQRDAYAGVQDASKMLQEEGVPRAYRKQIVDSFDIETINVRQAGSDEYGVRYFDSKNASPDGRYLFETFPADRQSLALPPKWNQMEGLKQWQLKPGSTIIEGRAAPQGPNYPGGQVQKYVLDPSRDLLEPGPL